jgi:hypothetical protein
VIVKWGQDGQENKDDVKSLFRQTMILIWVARCHKTYLVCATIHSMYVGEQQYTSFYTMIVRQEKEKKR